MRSLTHTAIWTLTASLAAAATAIALGSNPAGTQDLPSTLVLVALLLCLTLAGALQLRLVHRGGTEALDCTDAVLVVCLFALPIGWLVPFVAAAKILSQGLLRVTPVKAAFNVANAAWAAAVAGLVLQQLGGRADSPHLPSLAAAMAAAWVVSHAALTIVLLVTGNRRLLRATTVARWLAHAAGTTCVGLVLTLAWASQAGSVVLFAVVLMGMQWAATAVGVDIADQRRLAALTEASRALTAHGSAGMPEYLRHVAVAFGADRAELEITAGPDTPQPPDALVAQLSGVHEDLRLVVHGPSMPGHRRTHVQAALAGCALELTAVFNHSAQQNQIRAAHRQTEMAQQARSELLSRVSHELKTPLNAVLGFTDLLAEDLVDAGIGPDSPVTESLDAIRDGGRQLLAMVENLLTVSGAGSGSLKDEPVYVYAALTQAARAVETEANAAAVAVTIDPGCAPLIAQADADRVCQILSELLRNAVAYNNPGGLVRVSGSSAVDRVTVSVTDTGPGLDVAARARIFNPFERLDVSDDVPGMGLGLTIARTLAQSMGGDVTVVSDPGQGATFTLTLPRLNKAKNTAADVVALPTRPAAARRTSTPTPAPARSSTH